MRGIRVIWQGNSHISSWVLGVTVWAFSFGVLTKIRRERIRKKREELGQARREGEVGAKEETKEL